MDATKKKPFNIEKKLVYDAYMEPIPLAIPSFFEIKESEGVRKLSEKNRILFFPKPALIANLNAAREPESLPSRSSESRGGRWQWGCARTLLLKRPINF